jgi:hypothetical protein
MTRKEFKEKIEKKLPGAKVNKTRKAYSGVFVGDIIYKGKKFSIDNSFGEPNFHIDVIEGGSEAWKLVDDMENLLNSMTKDEAIKKTKQIRDTATKLPKKSLKLEDNIENFVNEIRK